MNPEHIRTLLDPDAMVRCLDAIPVLADRTARLVSLTLDRLWVKPGRHVHASYRVALETDAGTVETHAAVGLVRDHESPSQLYRFALDAPPRAESVSHRFPWDVRRSTALIDVPPMLAQLFPWDYRLPTLPLALDPELVQQRLALVTLDNVRVAGYWPGIRCQIRYEHADRCVLYGKVFPDGAGAAAARSQEAITRQAQQAGGFVTVQVHRYLEPLNLLLTEPVTGEPLPELLHAAVGTDLMARVATALAAFQALSVPEIERRFQSADDLSLVKSWIALVGDVYPNLAPALSAALGVLERRLPVVGATRASLVHRDFYDKQVLIGAAAIGLLDLDTACLGDGEIDVANFCAHLALRALQSHTAIDAFLPLQQQFVQAYRGLRPTTNMRLVSWYLASALLRLACIYALRPRWHTLAPRLIEESSRVLNAKDER